jgi:hypothetical protein
VAALAASACSGDSARTPVQPETIAVPLRVAPEDGGSQNHSVHMSGDNEVPPRDTRAQGQAIFQIARDQESLDYKLIASNIENVIMAHIHCGNSTVNGPIVIWLHPSPDAAGPNPPGGGRQDGVLAEGTVHADDVRGFADTPENRAACPGVDPAAPTFEDVLAKIRSGDAYVNVHTNDGVDPANTGPGDFPGGEIRGPFHVPGSPK